MASLLYQQIEMLSREKHIEPEVVVSAIEDAMVVAARKYYKTEEDLRAKFNQETGQVDVFTVYTVVEEVTDSTKEVSLTDARKKNPELELGSEIIAAKPTDVLGRIAAQTAKQVILQKVREAERDTIFNEYHTRVGELVTVIVKRAEGPDLIVDMGRTEARLPKREQSKLETYNIGERLRVVIKMVDRAAKGPQVIVSRADAQLVQRLFEMEVPEIYDGTVQIRFAAREAGERTKVAVASRDKDVDPVGACVGMKGMRVQSIIRELRGEKIDIIPYSEETVAFAQKALSPAKVTRVQITDPEAHKLEVIVEDSQLSLAIGKKGQNVRLASKLIGWDIDIKSEEEKRREIEDQMTRLTAPAIPLTSLAGVGAKTIEKMEAAGITSVEALAGMTPEQLMEIPASAKKWSTRFIRPSIASMKAAVKPQRPPKRLKKLWKAPRAPKPLKASPKARPLLKRLRTRVPKLLLPPRRKQTRCPKTRKLPPTTKRQRIRRNSDGDLIRVRLKTRPPARPKNRNITQQQRMRPRPPKATRSNRKRQSPERRKSSPHK